MASRKWLIRSLILAILAAVAGGGWLLNAWMRPEFIRAELTRQLAERFNDVDIEVGAAHLRILGGISISDLKLVRRDDPTHQPILVVPSAVLRYDKEQLNNGKLSIIKVEMFKPRLLVERDSGGKWNFKGIIKPPRDDEPLPIFVLHQADIAFVDRRRGEQALAEWKDVEATIVNDPAPVFSFQLHGAGRPTGAVALDGKYDKRSGFTGSLDLPNIPLGADLSRALQSCLPEVVENVKSLTGRASAHLDLAWRDGPSPALYHDLRVQLQQGRYEHPSLPFPLEQVEANFRSRNGDITIEKATARVGQGGTITVSMDLPRNPPCAPRSTPLALPSISGTVALGPSPLHDFEDRLRSLEVGATNLMITPEMFDRLPMKAAVIKNMFMPSGPVSMNYSFVRDEGRWQKRLLLQPGGMSARYSGFPYRMQNVRGNVVYTVSEGAPDHIKVNLLGEGAGSTVSIEGTIRGTHPDLDVDLRIAGKGVALDDELISAMPDDNPDLLRRLHATARGDFVALIQHNDRVRRDYGPETFANHFTIAVRDSSMKFDEFPYPLENMSGSLIVSTVPERPTRLPNANGQPPGPVANADSTTLEFHDFRASHNGATIRGSGRKDPAPGGSILQLNIDVEALPLDSDMQRALAAIHVENAWQSFAPSGRVNFRVRSKLYAKSDPHAQLDPNEDLELNLAFVGGVIRPNFFPYVLHNLEGQVSYNKGRALLLNFKAKHGPAEISLPVAEVLFRPTGGYWADLRDLNVNPLVLDEQFRLAAPAGIQSALRGLGLKGPMALHATRMVIDEQPQSVPNVLPTVRGAAPGQYDAPALDSAVRPRTAPGLGPPTIYWDGRVNLAGASMNTGVEWENVHGVIASQGLYVGDHFGAVRGNIVFDQARVAKQPVEAVYASLRIDPRQPDILSIPAIRGKIYGGEVGGEAWLMLSAPVRYALQLNVARARLSDVARQYKMPPRSHLEGLASAQIYLTNRADDRTGQLVLQGAGSIDVPNGKMLNLPVLLNLVKVVKGHIPDDTGFEEAHAMFSLRGDRVRFSQLDLIGNAVSLGGEGEMKTDGTDARFEFYPVWTKVKEMFAWTGDWTGAISKKFLKFKVTGDLDGKLDYRAEPVPGLVDPVKRILDQLK
jgi:hypothetical protein